MPSERWLLRRVAAAFAALYFVLVAVFATLRAANLHFQAVPWAEIAYGPAITLISSYLLFYAAVRLECKIRDRGRGSDATGRG